MSERSDLFWGIVIGLVGNLLVSTAFALVEHPEWGLFLNPVYILSWIAFVAFCSILLIGRESKKKAEPTETGTPKKEEKEKPDTKSLIAEYHVLNDAVQRRGSDSLLVDSIMIPSSLALVTFTIQFRNELGRNIFTGLPNAAFVPLMSLVLIVIPYILWCTTTKLDGICFDRIHEIEDELKIEGNKYVQERTNCKTWYKVRRYMWHFFFLLLIGAYIWTSYWLFKAIP